MSKTVRLPFHRGQLAVELPDDAVVLEPNPTTALLNPERAVLEALRSPIAGPPLRERVRAGQSVAVVISDVTRPVPNQTLLPPIFEELRAAGVTDDAITIVNGTGLHRPNTPEELREMLGEAILSRYRVVQHEAVKRETLVEVGRAPNGSPVEFCRAYVEADVRVVTGFVEPHLFAGFSGGAKGIMPGVAGALTIMSNHGAANLSHPRAHYLIAEGNPVPEEHQAFTAMCPPHFLLNVTLDPQRGITGVFAGDMQPAHEAAIEQAIRQYAVPIASPFDVVVSTNMGYPADLNFYQSVKGMSVAAEGVREGGAIILVAGCEGGLGGTEYVDLLTKGESPAALLHDIESRTTTLHDQWQVQCQAMVQAKADVYLHSLLSQSETEACHVRYCADVGQTVRQLVESARAAGRRGSVLVLPHGQLTVPVVRTT
jgi:nickel-dependent lactate racemase